MRILVSAILVFNFVFASAGYAEQIEFEGGARPRTPPRPLTTQNAVVVKTPVGNQEATITYTEIPDATPEKIGQVLADPALQSADTLVSSDNIPAINSAVRALSGANDKRLLRIIPMGWLASASEKLASGFKTYRSNVQDTLQNDRIGVGVLVITVGIDSMVWINAGSFSVVQRFGMIGMNLMMAATFGLDRELWGRINSPLKHRLIKVFDRFIPPAHLQKVKTIASQYMANMTLGMGIQLTRTSLLSLDHLSDVVTTGSFWLTAAKLSGLITLTTFAWSELYSGVNAEENPVAKTMLKRMGEGRGIMMAQLASVAMVLQPHVYGSSPIYSYVIHGTIGLVALLNAHRIVNWIENNRAFNKVFLKIQTFENYINAGLRIENSPQVRARVERVQQRTTPRTQIRTCQSLFAR